MPSIFRPIALFLLVAAAGHGAAISNAIVFCAPGCISVQPNTPNPIDFDGTITNGALSLDLVARTAGEFGKLRAEATYSNVSNPNTTGQINTLVRYADEYTISAPGLAGQTGYLVMAFDITGSQSSNGAAQVAAISPSCLPTCPSGFTTAGNTVTLSPIQFIYGQQFPVQVAFAAVLFLGPGAPATGFADYFHTAELVQFQPLLSDQTTPVDNPTIAAASGVTYSVDGVVPEPATGLLSASALAGIALLARRRRA